MCKRNNPDKNKNEASMGVVRETPLIFLNFKSPDLKKKVLKRKVASTGCVRETPCIKIMTALDV